MENLKEQSWFDDEWATSVRNSVRTLVRAYTEAYDAVESRSKPVQLVSYGGIRSGRSVLVIKALLKEAISSHVHTILRGLTLIRIRAYAAARPTTNELRLGVKKTAAPNVVEAATARRDAFAAKQELIAKLLGEAAGDMQALEEALGESRTGQKALKAVVNGVRRVLPLAWTGYVVSQFSALHTAPQWQLFAFAALSIVAYHLLAWLTLPFYHAADRQYVLFEGYTGGASDGLKPMFPEVSRHETALFKLLGAKRPIVISWEYLIPPLHYAVISTLLIMMIVKLPFEGHAREVAAVFGIVLILNYINQIRLFLGLLRGRHQDRSMLEIIWALLLGAHSALAPEEQSESEATSDKSAEPAQH